MSDESLVALIPFDKSRITAIQSNHRQSFEFLYFHSKLLCSAYWQSMCSPSTNMQNAANTLANISCFVINTTDNALMPPQAHTPRFTYRNTCIRLYSEEWYSMIGKSLSTMHWFANRSRSLVRYFSKIDFIAAWTIFGKYCRHPLRIHQWTQRDHNMKRKKFRGNRQTRAKNKNQIRTFWTNRHNA